MLGVCLLVCVFPVIGLQNVSLASVGLEPPTLGFRVSCLTHFTIHSLVYFLFFYYLFFFSWHRTSKCNLRHCWTWTTNLWTLSQHSYILSYPGPCMFFLHTYFSFCQWTPKCDFCHCWTWTTNLLLKVSPLTHWGRSLNPTIVGSNPQWTRTVISSSSKLLFVRKFELHSAVPCLFSF